LFLKKKVSVPEALKLHNTIFKNLHITVDTPNASFDKFKERATFCAFVNNIPWKVEEEEIRAVFSKFGEIDYVRVIRDKWTK